MSYLRTKKQEQIDKLEAILVDPNLHVSNEYHRDKVLAELVIRKAELVKLETLEKDELDKVVADIKVIKSHIKAIDDKYSCRSVKIMFSVTSFLENHISKSLATKLRDYTIYKIHAPFCSIVLGKKSKLQPMPQQYNDSIAFGIAESRRKDLEELIKFRELSIKYMEEAKPTRWEHLKSKINACLKA